MGSSVVRHIAVVGAGPGGLTTAMILAHRGFKVTVFEKSERVGGRNAAIHLGPYVFDTGPTFLMLKDVLDEVFRESGTSTESEIECIKLDPMYRLAFHDRQLDATNDQEKMKREMEKCFPGRSARYDVFFAREKARFRALFPCLQKSYHSIKTLFQPDLLKALPWMSPGRSLFDVMFKTFGDEQMALSFTFQSKYLGMSPWECPGLFAMIPYIEHAYGIYHVTGGLSRISDAMADVAVRQGAVIHCSTPVRRVIVRNGSAAGVELESGDKIEADDVVINADFGYAVNSLFSPGETRKWTPSRIAGSRYSCSTYMMYLGLDKVYDTPHHTIFFAENYRSNVDAVFRGARLDPDISFYVRNSSVTDRTVAPEGHSALYVLVPVPNLRGSYDWASEAAAFRENVIARLEERAGMGDIRNHIVKEKVLAPVDWQDSYNCYIGSTFNLSHNISQMIFWRPHNMFEDIGNCYLAGGGTHPGSGLPTIYESGRIAANLISRKYNMVYVSGNLEV